jgi:ABC-2 type transport system ATP-binding protein
MTSIIEVQGLMKRYRGAAINAVDNISFNVVSGEFFTLLGPNGAGKTTTISICQCKIEMSPILQSRDVPF